MSEYRYYFKTAFVHSAIIRLLLLLLFHIWFSDYQVVRMYWKFKNFLLPFYYTEIIESEDNYCCKKILDRQTRMLMVTSKIYVVQRWIALHISKISTGEVWFMKHS